MRGGHSHSALRPLRSLRLLCLTIAAGAAGGGTFLAAQAAPPARCTISGTVKNGTTPLPGVSVVLTRDGAVAGATSSDEAGAFRLRVAPGDYGVAAQMAAFSSYEGTLTLAEAGAACAAALDVQLTLASRTTAAARPSGPIIDAPGLTRRPGRIGEGRGGAAGQGQGGQGQRFAALQVLQSASAGAAAESTGIDEGDPATRLLPPGFSTGGASEVVAVTGNAANLDRGQLRDRLDALGRGEFGPAGAEPPAGVAGGAPFAFGGFGNGGAGGAQFGGGQAGPGGRGLGGPGGPGGRGGFGGFLGRGGSDRLQGTTTYTFGGSALDAAPYPLRSAQVQPDYTRQQFGATVGGRLHIPHLYDGTRTTFTVNYSGGRSQSLVDQYATVPTPAMRLGDFSANGVAPIDPATGLPFPNAAIPFNRIDPASRALLDYLPLPNLAGLSQNFRRTTTADTTTDAVNFRLTHNFTSTPARGGGRGGGFGGQGGRGGRGGFGRAGTAVVLNAQVQYQRNDSDAVNVFPSLGGRTVSSSFSAPVTLNVLKGRTIHNLRVTATHTRSDALTNYSQVTDVAGAAGIAGVSTNPFDWGVPALSFGTFSSLRDLTPTWRADTRIGTDYTFTRPFRQHTLRAGGGFRHDLSDGWTGSDARGTFVFTGLYSAGGGAVPRGSGLDFADFLLGLPQQASVGFGPGAVKLRGNAFNLFVQDDWRARSNLTFNLGVRYELVRPYTEADGHMANLDVTPDFTAAAPVVSGGTGAFTGPFPSALLYTDANNLAPRVGFAWRASPRVVVRGGYGIGYNNGAYSAIARQLVAQPPFANTETSLGTLASPLEITDAFGAAASTTTNNYGIDKNYLLGMIQTWNADVTRSIARWQIGGGYTGTKGSHLDIVRAPNRGPDGPRIEDVQPFLWQTSEGTSVLHALTIRARRPQVHGISGSANYTLAKSIDNASTIGGGGTVVAQNDQDLEAERGLSSFDRRHQFDSNLSLELPFGTNRPWLNQGGRWAAIFGEWSLTAAFTAQSGTPYTARVLAAASDVARGTNGTLRANFDGAPVALADPTLLHFFNTSAFSVPPPGSFGTVGRNTIIGPGQTELDASLTRDVRFSTYQALTLRLDATNLLNSVRFGAIDTAVNSPTFGQVISIRPMRTIQISARFRF